MDTDQGLAIGAIASVVFFGICGCFTCFYKDCRSQRATLKQSRSDPDLENMIAEVIPSSSAGRYASPPTLESTASLRKESSFE